VELTDVLSDKPIPARTETTESATDVKPVETKVETPDPAASSAAKETKTETKEPEKPETRVEDASRDRDDKGRFTKTVPQEALHAEKAKRRELEQKLQQLQQQQAPPKPTSVLEDEDKAFAERLSKHTQPIIERFFKLSVKAARNAPGRTDYEDVAASFTEAAESNPQLWSDFRNSDDPGEFVYSIGKQHKELGEVGGDILKYGEKKRAEGAAQADSLKAEIAALKAEIGALKESKDKQDKVPQSLNGEQSATAKGSSFAGPTPLKSILS
jgi:hypothetical protein